MSFEVENSMGNDLEKILFLSKFFRQEFQLCYQPILSLQQQRLYAFEALIAWQPDRAQIYSESPSSLVKESQLDVSFYELLFYEACLQMREWKYYHLADVPLQLNVDVPFKQLCQVNPLAYIEQSLERLELTSNIQLDIQLEIPADWILKNSSKAKILMSQARKMGLSICVDDLELSIFFTDFWKDIPANAFKLRKGGIKILSSALDVQTSFQKALSIMKENIKILVQDIENVEQLDSLKKLGCTHGQSGFCSQLMSSRQATKLIRTHVRQQPKDLMVYLLGMNIINQVAESFLGQATVIRYWRTTRPTQPWLALIEPYKERQTLLDSMQLIKLSTSRQQDLRQWIHQFIQRCTLIIKDFPYLLIQANLTESERITLSVLLPNLL